MASGNPYYTGSPIPDLGDNILKLMQLKLTGDELGMRNRSLAEQERQGRIQYGTGEPGQPGYTPGIHQQELALKQADSARKEATTPPHQQTFGFGQAAKINAFLASNLKVKDTEVQKTTSAMAADPRTDNMTAYENFKTNWPQYRQEVIQKSSEQLQKAVEKDPNYLNTQEGQKHAAILDAIAQDESADLIDKFFEGPLQAKAMADTKAAAELQALQTPKLTREQLASLAVGGDPGAQAVLNKLDENKTRTPEMLTREALKERLKREPTASEVKAEMEADKMRVAEKSRAILVNNPMGGRVGGGNEPKAVKATIARLDQFYKQNERSIQAALKTGADTTNLEEANRLITETKAQILNGELDPKEIQWDRKVDRGQITSGKGATPKADKFASVVAEARAAIAKGADRKAVLDRLKKMGYTGSL